jgi:hypothetical protein
MANRKMVTEKNAENFSSEDQPNAVIPCALSAVGFEIWGNLKAVLDSGKPQIQAKVFEVFAWIGEYQPEFLISANRFLDIIAPNIQAAISSTNDVELLRMLLLRQMARFLRYFVRGYFAHLQAV